MDFLSLTEVGPIKNHLASFALWCAGVAVTVSCAAPADCAGDAGFGIARAYAIAVSFPDDLPAFARHNAGLFRQNGGSIRCARALGAALHAAALTGPSPGAIREQATDVASRAGRPDLAGPLADDMLASRSDMYRLADQLQELASALPAAAAGDPDPYHETGIYQFASFLWGMTEESGLLPPQELRAIRDMTREISEWYVQAFAAALP